MAARLPSFALESFLRHVDPRLLAHYVKRKLDLDAPEALDQPWIASLNTAFRERLHEDFECIHHLCNKAGRESLLDAMKNQGLSRYIMLDGAPHPVESEHDIAMLAFLSYGKLFADCHFFFECDRIENRTFTYGPPGEPKVSDEELINGLTEYLRIARFKDQVDDGRYRVDARREDGALSILITYETHQKAAEQFAASNTEIIIYRYRPLSRELAVYRPATGLLEMSVVGKRKEANLARGVAESLFLDPAHFDRSLIIDLSPLLELRAAIAKASEKRFIDHMTLVEIGGEVVDGLATGFTIKSMDVFKALDESIVLDLSRTRVTHAKLAVRYGQLARPRHITLKASVHKLDYPKTPSFPEIQVLELLIEWKLIKKTAPAMQ